MNNIFQKAMTWIKANMLISIIIGIVILITFFGRTLKKLFFGVRRVKHRRPKLITIRRRSASRTMKRSLPRSVGIHKASGKGYPKAGGGYIPFKRNKNGTIKKAWQVGGTVAAKSRMRKLRSAR
jgi:hypothetical protein